MAGRWGYAQSFEVVGFERLGPPRTSVKKDRLQYRQNERSHIEPWVINKVVLSCRIQMTWSNFVSHLELRFAEL